MTTTTNNLEAILLRAFSTLNPSAINLSGTLLTGQTMLHLTTISGMQDLCRWALKHDGKGLVDSIDANGYTALHFACLLGRIEFVLALVEGILLATFVFPLIQSLTPQPFIFKKAGASTEIKTVFGAIPGDLTGDPALVSLLKSEPHYAVCQPASTKPQLQAPHTIRKRGATSFISSNEKKTLSTPILPPIAPTPSPINWFLELVALAFNKIRPSQSWSRVCECGICVRCEERLRLSPHIRRKDTWTGYLMFLILMALLMFIHYLATVYEVEEFVSRTISSGR